MWRAQLLAACLLAVVAASGRTSGQPIGGSSGGSSGGGSGINVPPAGVAHGPEPPPAPVPQAAEGGGSSSGTGSTGLPGGSSTGGTGPPGASWLQVPGSTGRRDLDVQTLLQLRDSVENWEEFSTANGFQGWNDTSSVPVCSWSGVTCADDGTILTLSWQCRTCAVRAIGKLPPGLGALSTLATLDLQSNRFYSTLPKQWGEVDNWPQLQNIYLNDNNLTGTLPKEWGQPGALPSLLQLRADSNRLTGTLPQNWGIEETSMRELGVIRLSNNSLNGTLPEQWGTPGAFPQLSVLSLDRNNLSGTLPEIWGAAQAMTLLQELYLQSNNLTGGLPLQWGGPQGMARMRFFFAANNPLGGTPPATWGVNGSFMELKTLDINNTKLTGTLPPEWGNPAAMPALDALRIERNDLSGTIPPEWSGFETLSRLVLKPGNPRLCGPVPPGLGFSLCDDRDLTCLRIPINLSSTCGPILAPARPPAEELLADVLRSPPAGGSSPVEAPGSAAAPASGAPAGSEPSSSSGSGGSDGGGGGTNVGAIVGGVVGGVAAVVIAAALLAFMLGRRRQRRWQSELLRPEDMKPSSRPFISEEEEMERGSSGAPLSPFAAATAAPPREYSTSLSSRGITAATGRGSSPSLLSETDRRSSKFASLFGIGSGRLGSASASGVLARWCSQSRTDSLEPPSSPEGEVPSPGVPSAGRHVMAQIAEEEGGSSSEEKRKPSDEDAAVAGTLASADGPLPSPGSQLGSAAPSGGSSGGGGGGGTAAGLNRFFSAALPWSDWEIRPEELEIAKRPDGSDWVLGCGGFGKVYKALRHGVQPVAVKVIPVRGDQHEMTVAATRMEIAVLRACRDANIVQFQGAYLGPDQTMLVTEYMEGGDLLHNIAAGRVSWYKRGKKVALDIAKGLVFLHSRRVVHFDLKSPNILLTRDGTAKIADVGMAKIMNQDYVTGVVSTLAWSAPEMLWGAKCTERADIYSFGIVLWEICSGEAPERGRLRDLRVPEECPLEVRQLILECLEARPSLRPTALQLAERLSAASAAPPPGAKIPAARPASGFAPLAAVVRGAAGAALAAAAGAAGAEPVQQEGAGRGMGAAGAGSSAVGGDVTAAAAAGQAQQAGSPEEHEAPAAQQAQQAGSPVEHEAPAAQQAQQAGSPEEHEAPAAQQAAGTAAAQQAQQAAGTAAPAQEVAAESRDAARMAVQAPGAEQQPGSPVSAAASPTDQPPAKRLQPAQQQSNSPAAPSSPHASYSQQQQQHSQQAQQQAQQAQQAQQQQAQPGSLSPPASLLGDPLQSSLTLSFQLAPATPAQPTGEELPVERPGSAEARAALDVEGASPAAAPAPAGWMSSLAAFFHAPPPASGPIPMLQPSEQPGQPEQ